MKVRGFGKSVVGSREQNQDSFLIFPERSIFAVADGVGGGFKGEVASQMAVQHLGKAPEGPDCLKKAILAAQDAVLQEALSTLGEALMGSTVTAIHINDSTLELCHVGDSRCYLFRANTLEQLTEDHEIFDESLQAPVLASYLGIAPEVAPITIQEELVPLHDGDRILLCSDGLYKQVSENRIIELIQQHAGLPETLLETLCAEAATADYSDNVTVVFVEVG